MAYKFANQTCKVFLSDGRAAQIHAGQAWDTKSQVVKERPEMFDDDPPVIHGGVADAPVETATAAPGEKRATKRAAKRG